MNSRTLLAIPYEITRGPLAVVDTKLAQRLPKDSFPRLAFDRALGSYDVYAGRLLANEAIVQQGIDRITRSGKLAQAVALERDAAAQREQAQQEAGAARETAQQKRSAAQQRAVDGLDTAEATERQGKQAAASAARSRAAQSKQAVQERADQRTTAIREELQQADEIANARQSAAQRTAKAKLDDVSKTKADARQARTDANKLGDLANAKKNERKK